TRRAIRASAGRPPRSRPRLRPCSPWLLALVTCPKKAARPRETAATAHLRAGRPDFKIAVVRRDIPAAMELLSAVVRLDPWRPARPRNARSGAVVHGVRPVRGAIAVRPACGRAGARLPVLRPGAALRHLRRNLRLHGRHRRRRPGLLAAGTAPPRPAADRPALDRAAADHLQSPGRRGPGGRAATRPADPEERVRQRPRDLRFGLAGADLAADRLPDLPGPSQRTRLAQLRDRVLGGVQ